MSAPNCGAGREHREKATSGQEVQEVRREAG
jgi:hypothetical protein